MNAQQKLDFFKKSLPERTAGCNHLQGEGVCSICVPHAETRKYLRADYFNLLVNVASEANV